MELSLRQGGRLLSNPKPQGLEAKIVAALERLGHVLRKLLWEEGTKNGLTPIQIQTLLYLQTHPPRRARVGQLAQEFSVTPATVSDAVRALEEKGLVERRPDPEDGRGVVLHLTPVGEAQAKKLARWSQAFQQRVRELPEADQVAAYHVLLKLVEGLYRAGVITVARICRTCWFFRPNAHPGSPAPHHCALMDLPLAEKDLRIDCPEHRAQRVGAGELERRKA